MREQKLIEIVPNSTSEIRRRASEAAINKGTTHLKATPSTQSFGVPHMLVAGNQSDRRLPVATATVYKLS